MKYGLTIFGVKSTTAEVVEHLHRLGYEIGLIISVDKKALEKYHISGYKDLEQVAAEVGAAYHTITDYTLKEELDFFQQHQFDIGISVGWQRLIPQEVLDCFATGLFGFHGSSFRLPKGKGRSPMNWSLIEGRKRILNHFFQYVAGADAGKIFSVSEFDITPHDTILTLQYKSLITIKREAVKLLEARKKGKIPLQTQEGASTFYPKRGPEDGKIDFSKGTEEIFNLIRGVTRPFPGAFAEHGKGKVTIWQAQPFDSKILFEEEKVGEIVELMYGMPLMKTKDGSLLITEYESDSPLAQGDVLA